MVATGLQTVEIGRKANGFGMGEILGTMRLRTDGRPGRRGVLLGHTDGRKKLGKSLGKFRARGWEEEIGENLGEI